MVILMLGMAVVTFSTRFGAQCLVRQVGFPCWLERWLKHVPTGILTALIVPAILLPKGYLDISEHNNYLLAGVLAGLVAYHFKNTPLTLVLGIGAVVFFRWVGI